MCIYLRAISLTLLLAICSFRDSSAQNNPYIFHHISTEDGLSGSDVSCILQDKKGYIWIATNDGLQKYDGYSFQSFHHDPLDNQSLSSDNVFTLLEDGQNNIWSMTFLAGFNKFNTVNGRNLRINELDKESSKAFFRSTGLCMDKQGNIWLIGTENIAYYDIQTGKIEFVKNIFPPNLHPYFMSAQLDSSKNQLWLADTNQGVCMYDLGEKVFYCHEHNPKNLSVFNLPFKPTRLYLDKEKNLWVIANETYLAKYNPSSGLSMNYQLYSLPNATIINCTKERVPNNCKPVSISDMIEDSHHAFWLSSSSLGLMEYRPDKDSFLLLTPDNNIDNSFHFNNTINCIAEDRDGSIWIGTDKGINIFNPYKQPFHFVDIDPKIKFPKKKLETTDFIQLTNGKLLVATWGGGVILFDTKLNTELYLSYKNGKQNSIAEPEDRVWSMIQDEQNRIWIGCQHAYLTIVDKGLKSFSHLHPPGLENHTIINMRPDQHHNMWFSLYSGIGKFDPGNNQFTRYQDFHSASGIQSATSSDILPDINTNIWVATLGLGLQKFDPIQNRFTEMYLPEKNNPQSIPSQVINCMATINDSTIALGTGSGGIAVFNTHNKTFFTISVSDGLPSNNISALYFVPPATIWATTINRICKVDLVTRNIARFGAEDGIKDIDFSSCHHMYRTVDGRILVGYTGGFLYFHPDSVSAHEAPANILLTGIKIFDQSYSIDSFSHHSDTIQLSYKQNFLTIYFASLSYVQSNRINYFYQLEGVDNNWVNAHDQRFASYTNLQGGTYLFKVKCVNTEGISSNAITNLVLIIHPPFWATWWFELMIALVFAGLLYFLYRYRINQLLRLQLMRNTISKDLHDDVGATLSSITILSKVANDKMNDGLKEQSSAILSKINSYSEEMVEKMGDIVWAVNSSHESVSDILYRLKNFFVETAASKNIHLEFSISPELQKKNLPMYIRRNIYLICKEAINNAIKYAFCSTIKLAFQMEDKIMKLDIADDGIGFDQTKATNGNGLSNIKARAAEMKASVNISSGTRGTQLSLAVPLPRFR